MEIEKREDSALGRAKVALELIARETANGGSRTSAEIIAEAIQEAVTAWGARKAEDKEVAELLPCNDYYCNKGSTPESGYAHAPECPASFISAVAAWGAAKDEEIARLKLDIESGFMAGAYARLKNLQLAESERDSVRADNDRQLRADNERLEKLIRQCETCDGTGAMEVIKEVLPPDGREVYETVECAECHGTTISSWGQALDEAESLRAQLQTAQGRLKSAQDLVEMWKSRDAFIFESVGECHLMISRNSTEYADKFDALSLPARVSRLIAQAKPSAQGEKSLEKFAKDYPCHCAQNYPGSTAYHGHDCANDVVQEFVAQWQAQAKPSPLK